MTTLDILYYKWVQINIIYIKYIMNLIILTTAITRGEFHRKSIGKFYELYNDILKDFNIYHIINPSQIR